MLENLKADLNNTIANIRRKINKDGIKITT